MHPYIMLLFALNAMLIAAILVLYKPQTVFALFFLMAILAVSPLYNGNIDSIFIPLGPVALYLTDLVMLSMIAVIARVAILDVHKFGRRLFTDAGILMIVFLIWHIFRAVHGLLVVGYPPESVVRITAGRWFALLIIAVPLVESTDQNNSLGLSVKKIVYVCGFIIPFYGLFNMLFNPAGVEMTSSGTQRFLNGTANVFLGLAMILAYADFESKDTTELKARIRLALYMGWLFLGIIFSQHRSALIALAAIILLDFVFFSKDKKMLYKKMAVIGASVILLAFVFLYFNNDSGDSYLSQTLKRTSDTFNTDNSTSQDRLGFWEKNLKIFKKSPLIGDGVTLHYIYHGSKRIIYEPHNMFVNILTNEGLIGLVINMTLALWGLITAWKLYFKQNKMIGKSVFLFIVFFILYSTLNTTYTHPLCAPVYFLMLGYLIYYRDDTEVHELQAVYV